MKKHIKLVALAASSCLILATSACGGGESVAKTDFEEGTTMAKIAEAGTIKIGASPNQPGLAELNLSQEWEGFNIDLAVHLVSKLGLSEDDIEWVNTTAANRIPFIEQGKIDIFATALAMTPEREATVDIAGPYLETLPQLVVPKGDAAKMPTLKDIPQGTKICVIQGSQGEPRVSAEIPQAEVVEFAALTNCFRALEQGTVDAVDSTAPLLAGFVQEKPDDFEFAPMTYGEGENWGIGVAEDRGDLCEFFNEEITKAFDDGTIDELWKKYMGDSGLDAPAKPTEMKSC